LRLCRLTDCLRSVSAQLTLSDLLLGSEWFDFFTAGAFQRDDTQPTEAMTCGSARLVSFARHDASDSLSPSGSARAASMLGSRISAHRPFVRIRRTPVMTADCVRVLGLWIFLVRDSLSRLRKVNFMTRFNSK